MLDITDHHQGKANQNHNKTPAVKMSVIKKTTNTSDGEDVEKESPGALLVEL